MNIKRKLKLLLLVTISAFVILSYFKIKNYLRNETYVIPPEPNVEGEAPLIVTKYRLKDTDGMIQNWTLDSEEARMYKNNGIILFKKVSTFVNSSKKDKTTYNITSEEGTYYTGKGQVALKDNVVIKTSTGFTFTTQGVLYNSEDKSVKTNLKVTAKGPKDSNNPIYIEGVGLDGDFNAGNFRVLRNVRTLKESPDLKNKLDVRSQKAVFSTSSNTAVFEGNVDAIKNNMTIKGGSLQVGYEKNGTMNSMTVKDEVMITIKSKSGKQRKAYCDNAQIDNSQGKIELTGRPEFHVDQDIMTGAKITFFTDSDKVYVENVKAEVSKEGIKSSE
jgi:LPS export ABC transporter protein LptC/lipopolysaccharide transport protein LptA